MSMDNRSRSTTALDAAVDDALRSAPLEAPPPLLYAAVMRQVRLHPRRPPAPFRPGWLDLALSLFGAGMLAVGWLAWRLTPPPLAGYLRQMAFYNLQRLWLADQGPLLWIGLGLAACAAALAMAALSCAALGICSRRAG